MKPRRVSLETPARLLHVMFLAQLVVPILLMADLTTAWLIDGSLWWYGFGTTGQTVFGFCTVWVISILSVYLLGRYSNLVSLVRLKGPLIAVYSVIFSVAVIELLLQMLPEDKVKPALWPPAQQALLEPNPILLLQLLVLILFQIMQSLSSNAPTELLLVLLLVGLFLDLQPWLLLPSF